LRSEYCSIGRHLFCRLRIYQWLLRNSTHALLKLHKNIGYC